MCDKSKKIGKRGCVSAFCRMVVAMKANMSTTKKMARQIRRIAILMQLVPATAFTDFAALLILVPGESACLAQLERF